MNNSVIKPSVTNQGLYEGMGIIPIPRNDLVIVREVVREKIGSTYVPEKSLEGREYYVESYGPKVLDLVKGDQVQISGKIGENWGIVPGFTKLLIGMEAYVAIKYVKEVE